MPKQLKSLETTLAGALRREQMADTCIKKHEAEIEHLNRLVNSFDIFLHECLFSICWNCKLSYLELTVRFVKERKRPGAQK